MNSNKPKLWVCFAGEQKPVCLVTAKTDLGAKKKCAEMTSYTRDEIHVEPVKLNKGFYSITAEVG